jgi:hypothetical protein
MIAGGIIRCLSARRPIAAAPRPVWPPMTTSIANARIFPLPSRKKRNSRDPFQRELDRVPPVMDPDDLPERMERINQLAAIQTAHTAEMTERWKAGEFDHLYGPYRPKGVLMKPPPKIYVDAPERDGV